MSAIKSYMIDQADTAARLAVESLEPDVWPLTERPAMLEAIAELIFSWEPAPPVVPVADCDDDLVPVIVPGL